MGKDRGHTHSGEDPSEVPKMWCELSLFLKRNLLQLEFSEVQEIVLKRRKKEEKEKYGKSALKPSSMPYGIFFWLVY